MTYRSEESQQQREHQRVAGQAALDNWQGLYDWTESQPAGAVVGRSRTNSEDPLCGYLGAATKTRAVVWSVGPSIKTGYEDRLVKPAWVKQLIELTDQATGGESGPITREVYLDLLTRVKPA